MNKYAEGFLSALSFFTIIPLRKNYEISNYTMYFFTLTGLLAGFTAGIPYLLLRPFSPIIASAVAVAFIMIIYGFNHLDSVMDFGDSFMVRGADEKQRVIKDKYTGSGGIGMAFIIYIPAIAFLTYFNSFAGFLIIISGEMISKYASLISMYKSSSFGDGLGRMFMDKINSNSIYLNLIPLVLSVFFNVYNLAIIPIVAILMYALKTKLERDYMGLNGDLIGSIGEITRLIFYVIAFIFSILGLSLFLL
jgi:adenosylcobinamide-GDP ribazoletransferase